MQTNEYFRRISSPLSERRAMGYAMTGLRLIRAEPLQGRQRGFFAYFRTSGPMTSRLKLGDEPTVLLSTEDQAKHLFSLNRAERENLKADVESIAPSLAGNYELKLKIPGNRQGNIKNPAFADVTKNGQVSLTNTHLSTSYVLDELSFNITGMMLGDYLTSIAFARLSGTIRASLASILPSNFVSSRDRNLQLSKPIRVFSQQMLHWESDPILGRLANLNPTQCLAVDSTFSNPLTLVWGPPGTGKTRVLAWAVVIHLVTKTVTKIAITAFTNRAIDNAVEKTRRAIESLQKSPRKGILPAPVYVFRARSKTEIEMLIYGGNSDENENKVLVGEEGFSRYSSIVNSDAIAIVSGTAYQHAHLLQREQTLSDVYARLADEEKVTRRNTFFKAPTPVFDFLMVDEASQLKVAEFITCVLALKDSFRIMCVGDDKQLPPVVVGSYPEEFLTRVASCYNYLQSLERDFTPVMLEQTYRFTSKIAAFPSRMYYNNRLDSLKTQIIYNLSGNAKEHLFWELFNPERETVLFTYRGPLRAQSNELEAEIVCLLIDYLSQNLLGEDGNRIGDEKFVDEALGIITPHNAQINSIRDFLARNNFPLKRTPLIDTVDRFQGQERNVILISYGVSDPDYAKSEADFILSPNRFNVSITRPKSKYIVLISESLISLLPEEENLLKFALELQAFRDHFLHQKLFTFSLAKRVLEGKIYY